MRTVYYMSRNLSTPICIFFFVKACPKLDLPAFSWYSIFGCGAEKDYCQAKKHDILKKER